MRSRDPRGALDRVSEELSRLAKDVETKDRIVSTASISAGDTAIGEMIAEAMHKAGKEGVITVEESNTFGLELELTEGMRFDNGCISHYFATDMERMEAVLEDPCILVVNSKVSATRTCSRCSTRWSSRASRWSSSPRTWRARRSRR
jgi:chaperonin GroEL